MSADHLAVIAHEAAPDLHIIGGAYVTPSDAIVRATVRAAATSYDLVIVDAPPAHDALVAGLRALADRRLVLAYEEPLSLEALTASLDTNDWLIAAQSARRRLGTHDVFRSLPRDEARTNSPPPSGPVVGSRNRPRLANSAKN